MDLRIKEVIKEKGMTITQKDALMINCPHCGKDITIKVE